MLAEVSYRRRRAPARHQASRCRPPSHRGLRCRRCGGREEQVAHIDPRSDVECSGSESSATGGDRRVGHRPVASRRAAHRSAVGAAAGRSCRAVGASTGSLCSPVCPRPTPRRRRSGSLAATGDRVTGHTADGAPRCGGGSARRVRLSLRRRRRGRPARRDRPRRPGDMAGDRRRPPAGGELRPVGCGDRRHRLRRRRLHRQRVARHDRRLSPGERRESGRASARPPSATPL